MSKIMNARQYIDLAKKYIALTREDWEEASNKLQSEMAEPTSLVRDIYLMRNEFFAIMNIISGFGSNGSCTLCMNVDQLQANLESGEKSIDWRKGKPNCTQCVWGCIAFTDEYFDLKSHAIISKLPGYQRDMNRYDRLYYAPCVFSKTYGDLERTLEKGYVPDIIYAINERGEYMMNLIKKFRLEEQA